jgi:hypothetical protein
MPVENINNEKEAALFLRCREALHLQRDEMQDKLCITGHETVKRLERGAISFNGPTWVAVWFMLDESLLEDPENYEIHSLMDEVEFIMNELQEIGQANRLRNRKGRR